MTDGKTESMRYEDRALGPGSGQIIDRWGDDGTDESLVGLDIVLTYPCLGGGECRGRVRGVRTAPPPRGGSLHVVWTCSPKHDEEFPSLLTAEDAIGWHFFGEGRAAPSWMRDEEDYMRGEGCRSLFEAPPGSRLVDFDLPCDVEESFPWVKDERGHRWWATLARFNDPRLASAIAPGVKGYPLPLLLTMIALDLADRFARRLNNSDAVHPVGYGQLAELEGLILTVERSRAPRGGATADDDDGDASAAADERWRRSYRNVAALLLTLSDNFERTNDGWYYVDDLARVLRVCADLVAAVGAVLLYPPSDATREFLSEDGINLADHLRNGSFRQFVDSVEFKTGFPDAAYVWQQLLSELG